jgi:hypothetical protein
MCENADLTPPARSALDTVHTIASAGMAAIPFIGGSVVEIFKAVLATPLERRTQEWWRSIVDAIEQLQRADANIVPRLKDNEEFQSILLQATWAAIRNHHREKLAALHNAVINTAHGTGVPSDRQLLFVRYVDELSPSHLVVMDFFVRHEAEVARLESFQNLHEVFSRASNQRIEPQFFKLVCDDLKSRSLVRISDEFEDLPGLYKENLLAIDKQTENPKIIVTEMGRAFINFVLKNPLEARND